MDHSRRRYGNIVQLKEQKFAVRLHLLDVRNLINMTQTTDHTNRHVDMDEEKLIGPLPSKYFRELKKAGRRETVFCREEPWAGWLSMTEWPALKSQTLLTLYGLSTLHLFI